jgi:transcription elongation GreA/GreB family factor
VHLHPTGDSFVPNVDAMEPTILKNLMEPAIINTLMEPSILKRAVLKAARTHLENLAAELKERVADLRAVTMGGDDAESASQTESTRGSDVDLMNALEVQLAQVGQDLDRLVRLDPASQVTSVQFGAVVHTDQRNFLIAVSMDEFDAVGRRYLGVTLQAPVIQALLGRSVGDRVMVNGVTYTVEAVV